MYHNTREGSYKVIRFHYSCPESQGALLCQTPKFPTNIDRNKWTVADGYSDRIFSWHPKSYKKACEMINGSWVDKLPSLSVAGLKEFAKVLFDHNSLPGYVKVIYYFNVSSGYDCPYIIVLFDKISRVEAHH